VTVAVDDLSGLLHSGERAVFHGAPANAVESLHAAVRLAGEAGRAAEATAATWLIGVADTSCGHYGSALQQLLPLLARAEVGDEPGPTPAEDIFFGALAAATIAGIHRAVGAHDLAADYDGRGLAVATPGGEAAFECLLGLSADAVGRDERARAVEWLQSAELLAEPHGDEWWRQLVRLDWGRCEVELLLGDGDEALRHARAAVQRAEEARSPGYVAKGLLFQAVALLQTGADAAPTLRRAVVLAEGVAAAPVLWQAQAVLGALLLDDDPAAGEALLASARDVVDCIADELPPDLQRRWRARPNIRVLFGEAVGD
jgi:hypothetical protein